MKNNEKINSSTFYRRLLYLTYGIINKGKIAFEDLPYANEIAQNMIITKRFGFALMNISKYSNDRADGAKADVKLINQFLEDSNLEKRNLLIGTVISVFFRFLVEIRLLPQTTPISPAQTTEPINIFRQRRQVKL